MGGQRAGTRSHGENYPRPSALRDQITYKLQTFIGLIDEPVVITDLRQTFSVGLWGLRPYNGALSSEGEVWKYKHRVRTTLCQKLQ